VIALVLVPVGLEVAPSTYYAAAARPPSARRLRDEELKAQIRRVHQDNFNVYGVEKVWKQLRREGIACGRDRAGRLMAELELVGAVRERPGGQRLQTKPTAGQLIWWSVISARLHPTVYGSPT